MTEESKNILFYMLALAGLIFSSILFTGRIEAVAEELPSAPATPTLTKSSSILSLPKTDRKVCPTINQKTALYMIDRRELIDQRWVISGTVYASDFRTPVSDVLIEIWQAPPDGHHPGLPEALHYTFQGWARTNAAGQYETTIRMPRHGNIVPLYFRLRYQNRCPLGLQLFVVDDETGLTADSMTSALPNLALAHGEPTGPLLRGPLDMVLPCLFTSLPEVVRQLGEVPPPQCREF